MLKLPCVKPRQLALDACSRFIQNCQQSVVAARKTDLNDS